MAVWLSLNLSQGTPNTTARTTTVSATLTIHYSGGSYDGTQPSGEIIIDGQSFPFVKNFNYAGVGQGAASQGTGSTSITVTATVEYGSSSSRTVYASASFSRASGDASGSISLTPIGTSSGGGSSGGGDGDNSEEWEEGGSGGTTAKTGNVSIIGQKSYMDYESPYKTDVTGHIGLPFYSTDRSGVIIKFKTPYIGGPSTVLNINIKLSDNASYTADICYAICVSDANLSMYKNATYSVNDVFKIQGGTLNYNASASYIYSSIQTTLLQTETVYYLILWSPSDSDSKDFIQIATASNHDFNVDYINDGTGYIPDGRLPGNSYPVGQILLRDLSDNVTYYPDVAYQVTYANISLPYSYIVVLKFLTPNFSGVSESLDINLHNCDKYPSSKGFFINCALCTSDSNYKSYIDAGSIVNDENQIACVTLEKDELYKSTENLKAYNTFSIQTDKLRPRKYYYLIFWIPTDITDGGKFWLGFAKYHGINVNYNPSGDDSGDSGFDPDVINVPYDYKLNFTIGDHCKVEVYNQSYLECTVTKTCIQKIRSTTYDDYTFVFIADEGYKLSGCSVNGVPCDDTNTIAVRADYGEYFIVASAAKDDSGWNYGDSYDANDPPYIGEKSPDGSCYVLVKQADGTRLTVNRVYTEAGAYIGELVNGELFEDDYGTWRKYTAYNDDYFTIEAEALPGYTIDSHDVNGETFNFYASGIRFQNYYDLTGGWNFDPDDHGEVARIYTTATKINDSGKDYGSGGGTLYFYGAEYGTQYAVEFSYSDNKFYVTSVKVKTTQSGPYNTTFDLFVKINDVVIYSGKKSYYFIPLDWYDLNISGFTGITDVVKITLFGTSDYVGRLDNIASPTVQTIIFDGSEGGDTDLEEYYLIYIRAEGASCSIRREYSIGNGAYIGYLSPDFTENSGNMILDYYRIWPYDEFSVQIMADDGYELSSYFADGYEFKYDMYGMSYDASYDVWVFDSPRDFHPVLSFKATKLVFEPSNAVVIKSENVFDEYTPFIYTDVGYKQSGSISLSCEVVGCRHGHGYITNGNIDYDSFGDNYILDTASSWGVRGRILGCLYILKFTTPYFEEYANSISIYIKTGAKVMSSSDNNTLMNYAISTSDQNYDRYVVTIGVPYDEYVVANGTFNEVLDGISIIEDTSVRLQPNTDYYLFVWDTNSEGEWTRIEPAINHQVVVGCPEYDIVYQYVPCHIYYDTGHSWELLI